MDYLMEFLLVTVVLVLSLVSNTECDNLFCGKIDRPNMKFNLRSRGKFARFRCNKGYELLGHANAVCQSNGAWSVEIPRCIGPTCTAITKTPGLVVDTVRNGALLKFSCSAGMVRDGVDSIYCEDDKWSGTPPACKAGLSMGCDFESGLCGWNDDTSDDFDWTRNRGETPTAETGPEVDHTTNSVNGHYLFAESSSPQEAGKKARLISPIYTPDSVLGFCLEFYYHMLGPDGDGQVGQLDVYIKPSEVSPDKLSFKHQVFHKEGNQGDRWIKADFEIPEEKQPFQIIFQATILNSWSSDIAIDDIRLYKCKGASDDVGSTTATTSKIIVKATTKRKIPGTVTATTKAASGVNTTPVTTLVMSTNRQSTAMKTTTRATTPATTARTTPTTATTTTTKPTTTTPKPTTPRPATTTTTRQTTTTARQTTTTTRQATTATRPTITSTIPTTTSTKPTTTSTKPTTTASRPTTSTSRTTKTTPKTATTVVKSTTTSSQPPATTSVKLTTTTSKTTNTTAASTTSVQPVTTSSVAATTAASKPATTVTVSKVTSTTSSYDKSTTTSKTSTVKVSASPDDYDYENNVDENRVDETSYDNTDNSNDRGDDERDEDDSDTNSTTTGDIDNTFTNAHHSFETDDNGNHSSPVVDYDRRYKPGDAEIAGTASTTGHDGSEGKVGSVKEGQEGSGTKELLPLIIGVVAAVTVGAIVIAGLAYMWARNQRRKREKEEDDQMNIITEYVETTLNV